MGPQAGDRSRRNRSAASLSVPAVAFGSRAVMLTARPYPNQIAMRPRRAAKNMIRNSASFFGKAAVLFEPFEWRPDLSLPGALHNSGNKPAPPSEYTPLERRSAFLGRRGWLCARRDVGHNEKGPDWNRSPFRPPATGDYLGDYFSELFIDVNMPFRFEPRPLTIAIMARLMPAAINPYSIAVAADWSAKNLENVVFTFPPPGRARPDFYRFARWNLSLNR